MNSSEYYTETLKLQRQAAQEQTSIITEIKTALAGSGAEQTKALQDGLEKLSRAVASIEIPAASVQPASRSTPNITHITIQSQYYDYYWSWYWQWWSHYYNS